MKDEWMNVKKKCSEYIANELKDRGINTVFGVPGVNILPIFDAIERDSEMRMITCKTELASAYMADGYARVKNVGCFLSTTGPGIASAVNGLISSYYDSVPVMAISAQVNVSEYGKYGIQEMTGYGRTPDVLSIMKCITKDSKRILSSSELVTQVRSGIQCAMSARKGPVYIEIDEEILRGDYDVEIEPISEQILLQEREGKLEDINQILNDVVELLEQGTRIVLILGNGAKDADVYDIEMVADKFGMCIVSSYLAKGKIDNRKNNYLGVMGCYGNQSANLYIEKADLVLAVGVTLNYLSTAGWTNGLENKKIIRVDIDKEELDRNYSAEIKVHMGAGEFLSALSKRVQNRPDKLSNYNLYRIKDYDVERDVNYSFSPFKVIQVINKYIDEHTIVVADVGQNSYWAERYISVFGNNNYIVNGGNGSMGHGVAASIGVRCAQMEKSSLGKVLCICGDGGFMMMGNELSTAAINKINVVWIIFNNRLLGTQEAWCKKHNYVVDCSCTGVDYVKYAEAQGVDAVCANNVSEFERALARAILSDRATLIDVRLPEKIVPQAYYGVQLVDIKR